MAARSGPAFPSASPTGSLIVDIGGGTTEVAVISLGGIVVSRSIRIGGDEMDQDIVAFARREYNLLLGERTAEDIKIAIGSANPGDWDAQRVMLRGRDLLTGLPRSVEVGADQVREAIEPSVQQMSNDHGHIEETRRSGADSWTGMSWRRGALSWASTAARGDADAGDVGRTLTASPGTGRLQELDR